MRAPGPGYMYQPEDPWLKLRDLLFECMGMVPPDQGARYATAVQIGGSNSGPSVTVRDGASRQTVLQIQQPQMMAQGCNGMATVQVFVQDGAVLNATEGNEVLRLEVSGQSGTAGGTFYVDATKGALFSVSGDNVIEVKAFLESSVAGEPLVVSREKIVQANVHWGTSMSPQGELYASSMLVIAEAGNSDWVAIPHGAKGMIVVTSDATLLSALTAEFSTTPDDAGFKYEVLDPASNGCPIVLGVNYVRFVTTGAINIGPVFQYYI